MAIVTKIKSGDSFFRPKYWGDKEWVPFDVVHCSRAN